MNLNNFELQKQVNALSKRYRCLNKIYYSDGPLSGPAGCFVFGIDNSTGDEYYKDDNGDWQPIPSGSGGIESIVAGTNITVDDTDPLNPIVASTGGGGGLIELTKAQLDTAIAGDNLVAGQQYLITDFRTVHYIVDGDGTQYLGTIITGDLEPIIVTANTVNRVDNEAKSTTYPQDIIHVDFVEANWLDDLSFADLSGSPVIIPNWKGTITFRHDTLLDNSCGYDFRNCKFRRWKVDAPAWNSGTTYTSNYLNPQFVTYLNNIFVSLQGGGLGGVNLNQIPSGTSNFWVPILDLGATEYWLSGSAILPKGVAYSDFKTFESVSGTYEESVISTHFKPNKDTNSYYQYSPTILSNNVVFLFGNGYYSSAANIIEAGSFGNTILGDYFINNKMDGSFQFNMIGASFYNNIIGAEAYGNTFKEFENNIVGSDSVVNFVNKGSKNIIGNSFQQNVLQDANKNTLKDFSFNGVGRQFNNNDFLSFMRFNTINDGAKQNFSNGFIQNIDFTSATHIYGSYSCTLFTKEDGTPRLSYYNNIDVQVIVPVDN